MPEQFDALVHFLLADSGDKIQCPLPIHGTPMNRPRWDAYDAIARFHIFRDKYERRVPTKRPDRGCRGPGGSDWPEIVDQHTVMLAIGYRQWGEPVDEDAVAAAEAGLKNITPSSPLWKPYVTD